MQCIWTSLPNVRKPACRASSAANRCARLVHSINFPVNKFIRDDSTEASSARSKLMSLAHSFMTTAIRDTSILPSPFPVAELLQKPSHSHPHNPKKKYTAAEISRAAAQCVRIGCQRHNTHEPTLIVRSLMESVIQYKKKEKPDKNALGAVAIDFGQAISPRLAIHSLLHGLVRCGQTKKAGTFAWKILRSDICLHPRTLRLVTEALCLSDIKALGDEGFRAQILRARKAISRPTKKAPKFGYKDIQASQTRLAVQLFFAAKQHKRKRADQMFQQIVDACLLQGEIIVVAFLFAFLVKQWEVRRSLAEGGDGKVSFGVGHFKHTIIARQNAQGLSFDNLPSLEGSFIAQMLTSISFAIRNTPLSKAIQPSFEEAAQALAILASMLHDHLLPFKDLPRLISTLTSFPSEPPVKVWVQKGDHFEQSVARQYFDVVLDELVTTTVSNDDNSPLLECHSYNALLHYAMRRKLSIVQGERILDKMLTSGDKIKPNITTYNILLRSGTLFRRHDISDRVLKVLRERPENLGHSVMYEPSHAHSIWNDLDTASASELELTESGTINRESKRESEQEPETPRLSLDSLSSTQETAAPDDTISKSKLRKTVQKLPEQIQHLLLDDFNLDSIIEADSELRADATTLASYIAHLTATGHPLAVVRLVFFLIPELQFVDHPAHDAEARMMRRRRAQALSRRTAVQRAIALGPIFFTTVLNAVVKARQIGLAERLWILAKQAEKLSWDPLYAHTTSPWLLPIAAYTIMMQGYAAEARKGLDIQYLAHSAEGYELMPTNWKPKYDEPVKGWARFIVQKARLGEKRSMVGSLQASRGMGALLYRSMQNGGKDIYAQVTSYQEREGKYPLAINIQSPIPDERFFNAALDLFGRMRGMYRRVANPNESEWRRLNKQVFENFLMFGHVAIAPSPMLLEIVRAMHAAGYKIPAGFKDLLIGRYVPPPSGDPKKNRPKPNPFTFKPKRWFNPYRLPTVKTRGLPVRKALKIGKRHIIGSLPVSSESKSSI